MNEYSTIDAILVKNESRLIDIEKMYNDSLKKQNISDLLKVEIMEFLTGLRACLDHCWKKIPGRTNLKQNFPKSNSASHFNNASHGISEEIKAICAKYQEFNDESNWFLNFSDLCNCHKHVELTPQKREERTEVKVSRQRGESISWDSGKVTFGSGISVMGVPIDPSTQLPVQNNIVETEIITWVDFQFENGISALPFLKETFIKVQAIIESLKMELETINNSL